MIYLLIPDVLEKDFCRILTWCKHRSPVIVPRKQLGHVIIQCDICIHMIAAAASHNLHVMFDRL